MDEEYKKVLIENFMNWLTNKSMFEKTDTLELARMKAAWLEATQQADERNKCLNSVYHMANNNTKSIREE